MNKGTFMMIGTVAVLITMLAVLSIYGQSPSSAGASPSTTDASATHADTTAHAANLQSFGQYHVEAQVSDAGSVQLHFYGSKINELMPIDTVGTDLLMEAKVILPGEDPVPLTLSAQPYPGELTGKSSRFVGRFERRPDQRLVGLQLTLPLNDKTYRVQWTPESLVPGATTAETAMPTAATDTEAQKLFLTPRGLYTKADIDANGDITAADKYRGLRANHSMTPQKGQRICPITNTVADERFAWIISGKRYTFCCPPCIEEFVKRAKEQPTTISSPETYVK